ncbi:MAG TPA: Glu/Leu/Phe/Val dehydrogenase dimerization domain-containing protein [Thermoanaerobaculia bacterium]|jgi:leucine dehydrogenase|nr:Glu/Leu/Phe/Val dehydrogenase dimerization domain-containing protein [Thermoanaerobaculia bacterium]
MEDVSTTTDHERVLFCRDPEAGYRGVIALHSTVAGPAAGGTRLWAYATEEEAVEDALRLSRGMTYKNILAGLPLGGGKSVIFRAEGMDREAVFRAHGRFVERLGGRYLTAEDVGTSPADMAIIRRETAHVAGIASDPSPRTAHGVARAMRAAALHRWGSDDLSGRTVAIQGCGNVGFHLALELKEMGAGLVVTDVDPGRVRRAAEATAARAVEPEEIFDVRADVLAPCALGGVLNPGTIPRLAVEIVAGAANNQLRDPEDGERLRERDILYVPDYVANAGGVIGGCAEILGWSGETVRERVERIYDNLLEVLRLAAEQDVPPHAAADRLVERRLAALSTGTEGVNGWM